MCSFTTKTYTNVANVGINTGTTTLKKNCLLVILKTFSHLKYRPIIIYYTQFLVFHSSQ